MSYVEETLKRASVQSIREYLMYGDSVGEQTESYEERLNKAFKDCLQIAQKYDSRGEESELFAAINSMVTEHENVYMEIGIQAGFRLAKEMLT